MSDPQVLSRNLGALAIALLLIAFLGGVEARAQTVEQVRRRVHLLDSLLSDARVREARGDSLLLANTPLDTVRVGSLRMLTTHSSRTLAHRASTLAWPILTRTFGREADYIRAHPFLFQVVGQPEGIVRRRPSPSMTPIGVEPDASDADVARVIVWMASGRITERQGSALRRGTPLARWLGNQILAGTSQDAPAGRVYVEMVTARSPVAHRCWEGDLRSCLDAVGLVDGGNPLLRWYGPAERQALVRLDRRSSWFFRRHGDLPAVREACLWGGSDALCIRWLRTVQNVPPPLSNEARLTLVQEALRLGHPQGYERLAQPSPGSVGARLATAAGVPPDSLIAAWRASIMQARPQPVGLPVHLVWLGAGWSTLLALLAMWGSRWRHV